jgi:hypothetical protein
MAKTPMVRFSRLTVPISLVGSLFITRTLQLSMYNKNHTTLTILSITTLHKKNLGKLGAKKYFQWFKWAPKG